MWEEKLRTEHVMEPQHLFTLQELADCLMNVKVAIDDIRKSKTLKQVLGTLLAIGNFLNGKEVGAYNVHNTIQQSVCSDRTITCVPVYAKCSIAALFIETH